MFLTRGAELVFQDRQLALNALKLLSGSQLKRFASREEAEGFSKLQVPDATSQVVKEDGAEKATVAAFKSVPARELAPFRRAIEKGETDHVKQTVWANPRYLISSGDTAVILMAGPRYNACHVAAKADRGETLKTILQTVSDKNFVRSLYVSDEDATTESRCRVLLDCYLNTPDHGVRVFFLNPKLFLIPLSLCPHRHTIRLCTLLVNSGPFPASRSCSHTKNVIEQKSTNCKRPRSR